MISGEFSGLWSRLGGAVAAAVVAAVVVSGCSAGDVELNGKLFELAGLNNIGKKGETPELKERTGLVVPPDLNKLPDPNQPTSVNHAEAALDLIKDPDRAKEVSQEELQRQQAEACKDYDLAQMRGNGDGDHMKGPLGPCRKSVLSAVGNWMKKE